MGRKKRWRGGGTARLRAGNASEAAKLLPEAAMNLSDFALFLAVMKDERAHQSVLSIILDEPDLKLKSIQVEEVVLNKRGQKGVRLDAKAEDAKHRQIATEMQNDTESDDVRKRVRYYQSLLDSSLLKSGKRTKYRNLPSTVVAFITQEDIFGKDLAKYIFTEQCENVEDLHLGDGTTKLFLNMSSKNGDPVLVSLLQYMKDTRLDNPEILVRDPRLIQLDQVVTEVKQSEEWEDAQMSILSIGIERGKEIGKEIGIQRGMAQGMQKGIRQGIQQGIRAQIDTCREFQVTREDTKRRLMEAFSLSSGKAERALKKYW